jgi:signal transduction histidine kinase/CheY-like chemotaxis protein
VIPYAYPVVTALNFLVLARTKRFPTARLVQILASLLLPFGLQWSLGGFAASGVVMLWSMMAMIAGTVTAEGSGGARWLVPFIGLTTFSAVIDPHLPREFANMTTDAVRTSFLVANITVPTTCVFLLTIYLLNAREQATRSLVRANTALAEAMEQAGAASRAKSAFVADMSHEIRTPLNGVVGILEVLERTPLDHDQSDYVRTMRGSADALMEIVNQILDFSRLSARPGALSLTAVDARAVAEDVVARLAVRAHQRGVDVGVVSDALDHTEVLADANALTQVLTNLVGNAIKFTSQGSVTVCLSAADEALVIEIVDTGPGIAAPILETLFEPFVTLSPEEPSRVGSAGTGLGLSIAKRLTEDMGGTIAVESSLGHGSTFRVRLGLAPRARAGAAPLPGTAWLIELGAGLPARALREQLSTIVARQEDLEIEDAIARVRAGRVPQWLVTGEGCRLEALLGAVAEAGLATPVHALVRLGAEPGDVVAPPARALRIPATRERLRATLEGGERSARAKARARRALEVLVVEDNAVNRSVLRALLDALGVGVEEAIDGEHAVRATAERTYDLVLMDCQMPHMDGYEATRAIRAREQASGERRVPILALTAHVGPEHEARALEAGMDAHLTKPIRLGTLEAALMPYLSTSMTPPTGTSRAEVRALLGARALPLVDDAGFEDLSGLGGRPFLEEMLAELEGSLAGLRGELARALAASEPDRSTVAKLAHRMAGGSVTMSLARLGGEARDLEACTPTAPNSELRERFAAIERLADESLAAFRARVASSPSPDGASGQRE